MDRDDPGTTNPTHLDRLGDWGDHRSWREFVALYGPMIRSSCRRYRLDAEATEEFCQRVWIDLARRMRTFRYDPGGTFRGWLRRLCESRAIDLLRERKADAVRSLEGRSASTSRQADAPGVDDSVATGRPLLLSRAEEVQGAVRRRVDERTWQVFWDIAVEGRSVREASEAAGITYAAAFAAQKRVGRMLREEGRRFLADPQVDRPEVERTRG
jgi:RNA polymerase sigma factor (sigma-70 family)